MEMEMERKMEVEILSRGGRRVEKEIYYLLLPALGGLLGVLPGHIHLVVPLKEGKVSLRGEEEEELSIDGGMAEIRPEGTTLFLDSREM